MTNFTPIFNSDINGYLDKQTIEVEAVFDEEFPTIKVITVGQVAGESSFTQLADDGVEFITIDTPENGEKILSEINNLTETELVFILTEKDVENVAVVAEKVKNIAKDTFIIAITGENISNEKLASQVNAYIIASKENSVSEVALEMLNLMVKPSIVNIDLADLKECLSHKMIAGVGFGKGKDCLVKAMKTVIEKSLSEQDYLSQCNSAILSIIANDKLDLGDLFEAVEYINEQINENANIIFGTTACSALADDEAKIMIICDA